MNKTKIIFPNNKKITYQNLKINSRIKKLDFNELYIFRGVLDLSESNLKQINLKNVRWIDQIINPKNIPIYGELLVYSEYLYGDTPKLNWYKDKIKPLIYLGGKMDDGMDEEGNSINDLSQLRVEQENELLKRNTLRVYNPYTVITYPDDAVWEFPWFPGELDLKIIDQADYLFFDLRQVSEGTRAEFGYALGKGYHKSKRIFCLVNEKITNCLTLAILKHCIIVKDIDELLDLIEYSEILKKVRQIPFQWWKKSVKMKRLNQELILDWKIKTETFKQISYKRLNDLINLVEDQRSPEEKELNNLLLALNCEILEYLESNDLNELSDIFIFSTLLLYTLREQGININLNKRNINQVNIKPITHENMYQYLLTLLYWSGQYQQKLKDKIEYNLWRKDHKHK